MEVSDSMYRVLKRAIQIKVSRGEDGWAAIQEYKGKISDEQYEQMVAELIADGTLTV